MDFILVGGYGLLSKGVLRVSHILCYDGAGVL